MTGDPPAPEFEPVIERDPDLREPEQLDPAEQVEPEDTETADTADQADTADTTDTDTTDTDTTDTDTTDTTDTDTTDTDAAEEAHDPEGPRRRARRERAERREAQQRATAIESARREAKRKAHGEVIEAPKRLGDRTVKGLRMLIWLIVLGVASVGLGLVLYFTPVMSARSVVVVGTGAVSREEVVDVAKVAPGTPLLQIDTDAVADRVAGIRRVASARVQREYPSTLRITILERVPIVVKDFGDGPHLFDRDGVDFATAPPPPGLAYIDVDNPGPTDPPTRAALEVMTALRPEVAAQVSRVAAPSVASITLTLTDGRTVVWGTTERTGEKAEKLAALLTQPGRVYDVSSPDLPTVK